VEKLSLSKQIAYASGMMGWSIMVNIIGVLLPYFYLPPSNSGMNNLISQVVILGVFNLLAIITASGRLIDAVYDPFLGQWSDRSRNKRGRRIPFMMWSIIPSFFFCCAIFYPLTDTGSTANAVWLAVTLILFFMSATTYIIPYNAMMPEMAHAPEDKVRLSSFQQVGFVLGMVVGASSNNVAGIFEKQLGVLPMEAMQYAIWLMCGIGAVCMLIPVLAINEKKYCRGEPVSLPLIPAMKQTLSNKNFVYYITADFSYFMAMYIIMSGLQYYVTVLCGLDESIGVLLMGTMVGVSLLFYPLINMMARRVGKKPLVMAAFVVLGASFLCIYYLGKFPASPEVQMYTLMIIAAFPLAALGILPPAILAEIAEEDARRTKENKEGLYFAVKYFAVKLGHTFGIALFAMLTLYGKDPGNDYGLRLNGISGMVLCVIALVVFSRFKESNKPT
jgi:glycoside/pentoside/hexuronide:cation symporter, GPH family